jgi:hypothetical protein
VGKKLFKVIKNKPVDAADGRFDLVEALLEGDALMHWQEFKRVETTRVSKNPDGTDTSPLGVCDDTFKACLQELKKHYFPKNSARLQKAYLRNHIRKPRKLSIKNTAARLRDVNGMLARFPAPDNKLMGTDELCDILYRMVKHEWREALWKSGRSSSEMSVTDLVDYFEQIELLDGLEKKKSETITVDDDSDENDNKSKSSRGDNNTNKKNDKRNAKGKAKSAGPVKKAHNKRFCVLCQTYGGNPRTHDTKYCKHHKVITETRKQSGDEHMSVEELFATSKKLSKKLKKLKKKRKRTYESESSSDSDSD